MSRIGKKPVDFGADVKVSSNGDILTFVKGKLSEPAEIRVQGNVETDKDVLVNAEMSGIITSINVKAGQKVCQGTVIATVDAAILASNIQEIETQLDYAKYMLSKQTELNSKGVGSEFELETAKNQVKSLESKMKSLNTQKGKASIRAPFSGIIDQVFAKKGQMAGPQSPIVRLVNNNNVDIVANISEKHLINIRVGTPIKVSFPNYNDTVIDLKINTIGNFIEPTNRTFRIMSSIDNNKLLIPNMLAEIRITDLKVDNGLVIPSRSIQKDQDNLDFVYTAKEVKEKWIVSKVNIKVIKKYNGDTLIEPSEGIEAGTAVVAQGAKGITDKDIVRIK